MSSDMVEEVENSETPELKADKCCVCGTTEEVKRCSKCKLVLYCSKACQKSPHHEHHSQYCGIIADLLKSEVEKVYKDFSV